MGVKKGSLRSSHFFHLAKSNCALSGKSELHMAVQELICKKIAGTEIECPFPTIRRIADVAWIEKNIVFEIQCSPIAPAEMRAREADYAKLGLQVVWIFHIRKFRARISKVVQGIPHFFTDIDEKGRGGFFDLQYFKGSPSKLPLLIEKPLPLPRGHLPPLHFRGDRFDRGLEKKEAPQKKLPLYQALLYAFLSKSSSDQSENDLEE